MSDGGSGAALGHFRGRGAGGGCGALRFEGGVDLSRLRCAALVPEPRKGMGLADPFRRSLRVGRGQRGDLRAGACG